MSAQDPRTSRHRRNSSPSHSSRRKHKSESRKTRERSRSPRHTTSNKRTKRSPSPSKPKTSKHQKDILPSPPSNTPDSVSNELISKSADSSTVTDRTLLLKHKLEERKQKRQRNQSPASEFMVIDDVRNWVDRSRQLEFAQNSSVPESKNTDIYGSEDLKGMKIGHSVGGFLEGDERVLTLKDRDILDEETEETLENPTMIDHDRASKQREARSLRPGVADPFDDSNAELENIESALRGERLVGDVLTKYDEEISGEKTRSFYLSDHGQLDTDGSVSQENKKLESLLAQLGKKEVDLNFEHKFASQVMTSEEIAEKFRKIKRRRKVVPFRAEDLLKQSALPPSGDLGSRETKSPPPPTVTTFQSRKVNSDDAIGPVVSATPLVSELPPVEEDKNISIAIEKIRKLRETAFSNKQMDPIDRAAAIARQTQRMRPADKSTSSSSMIFDSTQEFVRSLNTQSSYLTHNRLHESLTEIKTEKDNAMDVDSDEEGQKDGWKELRDGSDSRTQVKTEDREDYFEAEPIVSHSLTSTLLLAERKGFIEQSRPKGYTEAIEEPKHKNDISARNYSLLDKQSRSGDQRERTRDREDYRDRDRDSFPEIKNYVPEIKLEYVDDLGRDLSQKEAFRRMSHIFHGKGSGKLKAERRLKKSEDELTMLKMNSFDTPLNAVAMATRKMETSGIPYLILSGGQHSLETGSVTESSNLTKKRRK